MPEEKLKTLFEPFSQVHEHGAVQERGSGLGLYISNKIITDLGGTLYILSREGQGSVFTIHLPGVKFSTENIETGDLSYNFFGDTVLIADDILVNIRLYEAYLSQHNLKLKPPKMVKNCSKKQKKFDLI